jgi:Kef-type K+ transport system membrane component KefB
VFAVFCERSPEQTATRKNKSSGTEKRDASFMKTKTPDREDREARGDRDATLTATYLGVAAAGLLLLVGSGIAFGARTMASVALGVVFALSNLWVLERLVRVYLQSERGRWAIVALVKAAVLFCIVAILVRSGAVEVLPLVAGFGALPVGVVVGGAWPVASAREES